MILIKNCYRAFFQFSKNFHTEGLPFGVRILQVLFPNFFSDGEFMNVRIASFSSILFLSHIMPLGDLLKIKYKNNAPSDSGKRILIQVFRFCIFLQLSGICGKKDRKFRFVKQILFPDLNYLNLQKRLQTKVSCTDEAHFCKNLLPLLVQLKLHDTLRQSCRRKNRQPSNRPL